MHEKNEISTTTSTIFEPVSPNAAASAVPIGSTSSPAITAGTSAARMKPSATRIDTAPPT